MKLNLSNILNKILNESVSQDSVVQAIQDKRVILMTYNDETETPHTNKRWTEPYALVSLPNGNLGLRAFQYEGDTKRGKPHWKLFRLDRIVDWKPTTSTFVVTRDGYNKLGDKQYPVIIQVQDNDTDNVIQQNLQNTSKENQINNVDAFGRKINKNTNISSNSGPVANTDVTQTMSQSPQQSGPITQKTVSTNDIAKERKTAWKKFNDLKYQKNKRDLKRAEKLRKQAFGDNDEEEIMNNFDKENILNR